MVAPAVEGIDLFKIAGRSISGWVPSFKMGATSPVKQPFCSQLEERLLLWLEYHPHVVSYARGDIGSQFAAAYRLPIPKHAPFAIGYTFEGKPHDYLPDVVGMLTNGKMFIAEAGMEDDKRGDRNLAKAEAARKLARFQQGIFWIGTERTLTRAHHYNLVYLHARRKPFPAFAEIVLAVQEIWPWGEVASVEEVESRLAGRWPINLAEATIWKLVGDSLASGHLLVDLEQHTLDRILPLALLPPDAPALVPPSLPEMLEVLAPTDRSASALPELKGQIAGPTVDASALSEKQREQFHRNLRAVEQVLAGASQTSVAKASGISPSTLSRLVQRTRERGQMACLPHGSYRRRTTMHPAFQECIRRLYLLPVRLSMTAIHEHAEMREVAARLEKDAGAPVSLPSYDQVRREIHRLEKEPDLVAVREQAKALPRARSSPDSFVLSIPAPALLTQVDEHSLELYVMTPDGIAVTQRVHAAVLVCVKTAAILGAVLALGPLKEEDYMRLLKQAVEPKDRLVLQAGCEHSWPCYGKPAIVFHDRGKIFTSERARQVLVDRLGIITEQAPPYAPSAKGTVESLFRWMTQRFERRLPNTSFGVHDAKRAAEAGGMTLEELERCFIQAVVDDYQQAWDDLRRQRRCVLWEQAVAQSGVPQYLGSPDDLKLLLMRAVNRKTPHHGYQVSDDNRLSFQGRWYVCPGLLSRLAGRAFDVYFDRRDISVLYLFVDGVYVGEAYCPQFLGDRVSEWEANAMRKHDEMMAKQAREQGREVRARIQSEAGRARKRKSAEIRQDEHSRQWDRQREEIHPAEVLERLASVKPKKAALPKLPPAVPDSDADREVTCLTCSHGTGGGLRMTHPLLRKEIFVETAFERRFQAMLRSAWYRRSWHVIVADPGSGKTMGIRDLVKTAGSRAILAIVTPKNNEDEQALGDQLYTALGLPLRGHWRTRKPKLMGHLHQYGTQCLIVDDAHDLSLEHLMFIKEITDQGRLQYDHPLGLCLVAAGRGNTIPLKETLDLPDPTWLQFRRRLDKMNPFCRIAGHTSEEVREILAALEIVYRELFPQLNLRRWTGSIYTWLTQPVLDPTSSGRVTMDYLMKLVTTALEWTYQAGETDVRAETLEVAASLLVLRRDTLRLIDGAGPDIEAPRSESTEQKQASGTEVEGVSESANPPENPVQAQTLHTDKGDQISSEHATSHSAVMDQKQPTKSTKCTFSGAVPIDLKRFLESDVALVECPDCAATRTLEPHGGILRAVVSRQTQNGDSCDLEAVGKGENGLGCGWRREQVRSLARPWCALPQPLHRETEEVHWSK